jgi:hypothetical protein
VAVRRVDIRYNVRGASGASRAADLVAGSERNLRASVEAANKAIREQENAWTRLGATAVSIESAMSVLRSAIDGVKRSMDALKGGAQVRDVARAFEVLGGTAAGLAEMRDNLRGAVSDNQIRRFNNMARALGLTSGQFKQLTPIANAASNILGIDVSHALESVTTGVARGSKLWLDNLGIIVDSEGAYKRLARELGVSVDKLTDAQKKQAFFNEVVKAGNRLIDFAPLDGYADAYNRVTSAINNASDSAFAALSKAFAPMAEELTAFLNRNRYRLSQTFKEFGEALSAVGKFVAEHGESLVAFVKTFFAAKLITAASKALGGFVQKMASLPEQLGAATGAAQSAGQALGSAYLGGWRGTVGRMREGLTGYLKGLAKHAGLLAAASAVGASIGQAIGKAMNAHITEEASFGKAVTDFAQKARLLGSGVTPGEISEGSELFGRGQAIKVRIKTQDGNINAPLGFDKAASLIGREQAIESLRLQKEIYRKQAEAADAQLKAARETLRGASGTAARAAADQAFQAAERAARRASTRFGGASRLLSEVAPPVEATPLSDGDRKKAEKARMKALRQMLTHYGDAVRRGDRVSFLTGGTGEFADLTPQVYGGTRTLPTLAEASAAFRSDPRNVREQVDGQAGGFFGTLATQGLSTMVGQVTEATAAFNALIEPISRLGEIGAGAFNALTDGIGQAAASAIIHGQSFQKSIKAMTASILESVAVQAFSQAAYLSAIGIAMAAGIPIPGVGVFAAASAGAAFSSAAALAGVGAAAAVGARAFGGGGGGGAVQSVARQGGFDTPGRGGLGVGNPTDAITNNVTVLVSLPTEPTYDAMASVQQGRERSRARASMVPA